MRLANDVKLMNLSTIVINVKLTYVKDATQCYIQWVRLIFIKGESFILQEIATNIIYLTSSSLRSALHIKISKYVPSLSRKTDSAACNAKQKIKHSLL